MFNRELVWSLFRFLTHKTKLLKHIVEHLNCCALGVSDFLWIWFSPDRTCAVARCAAFSQWSSCPGFGIPTWQRLWSVFSWLTWNGFKSRAATLDRGESHIRPCLSRIVAPVSRDAALSPHTGESRSVCQWCDQIIERETEQLRVTLRDGATHHRAAALSVCGRSSRVLFILFLRTRNGMH